MEYFDPGFSPTRIQFVQLFFELDSAFTRANVKNSVFPVISTYGY